MEPNSNATLPKRGKRRRHRPKRTDKETAPDPGEEGRNDEETHGENPTKHGEKTEKTPSERVFLKSLRNTFSKVDFKTHFCWQKKRAIFINGRRRGETARRAEKKHILSMRFNCILTDQMVKRTGHKPEREMAQRPPSQKTLCLRNPDLHITEIEIEKPTAEREIGNEISASCPSSCPSFSFCQPSAHGWPCA